VAEHVCFWVVDQQLNLAIDAGSVDPRRLVAADVHPPLDVEGEAVRQPRKILEERFGLAGGAVRADRDPDHSAGERLGSVEHVPVSREGDAVGEAKRPIVPEAAGSGAEVESPDAGSGLLEVVAVGDVQAVALGVDDRDVRDLHLAGAVTGREANEVS